MNYGSLIAFFLEQGPLAAVFVVLLFLFYSLTWRVWKKAMEDKDKEIERLIRMHEFLLRGHSENGAEVFDQLQRERSSTSKTPTSNSIETREEGAATR
jgi:hypothetical protein